MTMPHPSEITKVSVAVTNEDMDVTLNSFVSAPTADADGNDIVLGAWYWCKDRRGDVCGVGKFFSIIGSGRLVFCINGSDYDPANFVYARYNGKKPFTAVTHKETEK